MIETFVLSTVQRALLDGLWVLAPLISIGLIVGLAVSIFQSLTQIQDATLAFVVKIIATFAGLFVFGNFILAKLMTLTISLFDRISEMAQLLK